MEKENSDQKKSFICFLNLYRCYPCISKRCWVALIAFIKILIIKKQTFSFQENVGPNLSILLPAADRQVTQIVRQISAISFHIFLYFCRFTLFKFTLWAQMHSCSLLWWKSPETFILSRWNIEITDLRTQAHQEAAVSAGLHPQRRGT